MARTWVDGLSQRARRRIAAASLIGLPGMYAWSGFWLTTRVPGIVWGPVSFLLILITVGGALVLYRFVRDRAGRDAQLDERQRQLRDRAWIMCYEILAALIVAAVLVLGVLVLGLGRVVTLDATAVSALVLCVGVLLPLLPVATLAWIEPDAPAEA